MFDSRAVRYFIYGSSAVIISELVYHCFHCLRRVLVPGQGSAAQNSVAQEVSEVIWTNELTQMCSGHHEMDGVVAVKPLGANGDISASAPSYIVQLPKPTTDKPCNNRYCAANNVGRLIALIDQAKYCIDLAMYTFTSYELSQAFNRAIKRGIDIRIISDKEMVYSSGSQIIPLTKAEVPVRCPSSTMLMHHKFCILDGSLRSASVLAKKNKQYDEKQVMPVLMSGSLNWTMQGFGGNWENIIITSNKPIVNQFEQEYERMWTAFDPELKVKKQ